MSFRSEAGDEINQRKVKRLKKLRNEIHWEIKNEREEFFREFKHMALHWKGQFPNLQDFFENDEIDWLLTKYINIEDACCGSHAIQFVKFMAGSGCKDKPYFYKNGRPQLLRTTPVHQVADIKRACRCSNNVLRELFKIYDRYDVNYSSDEDTSHFHIACMYDLDNVVKEFLEFGQDPDCLAHNKSVNPPLHEALISANVEVVRLLMASGANPNLTNFLEQTPLHVLSQSNDGDDLAELFFIFTKEVNKSLQVNARDNFDETPLHYALRHDRPKMTEQLLRNGANPNLANKDGETPLHTYFQGNYQVGLMNMLFELSQRRYQPVQVNVRDKVGNTPLHYASLFNNKEEIKLLLRKGADTNSTNNSGSTPLHIICMSHYDILNPCESVRTFFEINNRLQRTVIVDARDNLGRTPLQWAVANLMPSVVELLLDGCSADLSNFVFPTEDYFGVQLKKLNSKPKYFMKSKLCSCTLLVVRILERKGYELDQSDALTIMKFFDKYELFEESADIEKCYNDEEFTNIAKKKMITESLSLYDLLRLRPEVFKKGDANEYFTTIDELGILPKRYQEICIVHLCEMMWRRFFLSWALDPYMVLTHYRLPILCCDMIIENLNNKDLFNICLATTNQISESE